VRIAIVNHVPLAIETLRRCITSVPGYEVVWTASNGAEAVARAAHAPPDLILMDLMMPVMGGIEATRLIMRQSPCAILIVTSDVEAHTAPIFEALAAGALDVTQTPIAFPSGARVLLEKIRVLSRLVGGFTALPAPVPRPPPSDTMPLISIGSSAGGPAALAVVLTSIPPRIGAAIVIVQHIDAQFAGGLAEWLRDEASMDVHIAREGDRPTRNAALLGATDDHLIMLPDCTLRYTAEPREAPYRPSVDVFFDSAARHWPGPLIGVLLTGMGRDGTAGLQAIQRAGGLTVAQDQATSVVYGMPKAAAEAGAAAEILPLEMIGPRIASAVEELVRA
jgi:two-component system response regulator WspF